MTVLRVRGLSARWHPQRDIGGVDGARPASFRVDQGQWLALVGRNGLGKSTLLAAIAGFVPFVAGRIEVNGLTVYPRRPAAAAYSGVQLVAQHARLLAGRNWKDAEGVVSAAVEYATGARGGLKNSRALDDLCARARSRLRFGESMHGEVFELVAAVAACPQLLLLDEVRVDGAYDFIRECAPSAAVVFVDHDVDNAFSNATHVMWLQRDAAPLLFEPSTAAGEEVAGRCRTQLLREEQGVSSAGATAEFEVASVVRLEEAARSELALAWAASRWFPGRHGRTYGDLRGDFPFLDQGRPASELSGGQKATLAALLLGMSGRTVPRHLMFAIDEVNRRKLRRWVGD